MAAGVWVPSQTAKHLLHPSWRTLKLTTPASRMEQDVCALRRKAQKVMAFAEQLYDLPLAQKRSALHSSPVSLGAGGPPAVKIGRALRRSRLNTGLQQFDRLEERHFTALDGIPPPRERFAATQARALVELVNQQASIHLRRLARGELKVKEPLLKPPKLLTSFSLHIKPRPISPKPRVIEEQAEGSSGSSDRSEEESEQYEKPPPHIELDLKGASAFNISRYNNSRKEIKEKLDYYHMNAQSRVKLKERVDGYLKEKNKTKRKPKQKN